MRNCLAEHHESHSSADSAAGSKLWSGRGVDHLHGSYPQLTSQLKDSECFENLASVWTHYGRPPQYREMFCAPSTIQGKTHVTRWGTWCKALKAFVDWANSEASSEPSPGSARPTAEVAPTAPTSRTEADCREVRPGLLHARQISLCCLRQKPCHAPRHRAPR
jgi:hypothetical protein